VSYETKRFRGIVSLVGLLVIVVLVLSGCSGEEIGYKVKNVYDCSEDIDQARAVFLLNCIKNANPNSDEEPEDWLYICERISLNTYCPKKQVRYQVKRSCFMCAWYETGVIQ
jgi:hypothetical protein